MKVGMPLNKETKPSLKNSYCYITAKTSFLLHIYYPCPIIVTTFAYKFHILILTIIMEQRQNIFYLFYSLVHWNIKKQADFIGYWPGAFQNELKMCLCFLTKPEVVYKWFKRFH